MSHLKFRPGPERDETPERTLKFPGNSASTASGSTDSVHSRHPAELALERAQRRLDNLREVLGPAFGRQHDGPRAA